MRTPDGGLPETSKRGMTEAVVVPYVGTVRRVLVPKRYVQPTTTRQTFFWWRVWRRTVDTAWGLPGRIGGFVVRVFSTLQQQRVQFLPNLRNRVANMPDRPRAALLAVLHLFRKPQN